MNSERDILFAMQLKKVNYQFYIFYFSSLQYLKNTKRNNFLHKMENNDSIHENDVEEDNTLMYIYEWVDSVPLSRQKKNIARNFNDGDLLAEMIKYHYPKLVDLHNYPSSSSTEMKLEHIESQSFKKIRVKNHKRRN